MKRKKKKIYKTKNRGEVEMKRKGYIECYFCKKKIPANFIKTLAKVSIKFSNGYKETFFICKECERLLFQDKNFQQIFKIIFDKG